jgi:hypothetical protein
MRWRWRRRRMIVQTLFKHALVGAGSIQLRPAISRPRTKKAPGGRMAIRKPG